MNTITKVFRFVDFIQQKNVNFDLYKIIPTAKNRRITLRYKMISKAVDFIQQNNYDLYNIVL